jgi:hypothetical protein
MYTNKHYSKKYAVRNYHSFPPRENRIKATGKKIRKADTKLKRGGTLRIVKE